MCRRSYRRRRGDQPEPGDDSDDEACQANGSIIGCQDQTLGERLGIVGTPFSLVYESDRVALGQPLFKTWHGRIGPWLAAAT